MPFQVSYSAKATPVGLITFFSAGEDQPAVCDGNVTMTAIVIGDLSGHTVLWEQLTGPAVTWTSPQDQLQVTYTVATFEDRSFRFYIDKDTGSEQSDDINIFGTPTEAYYFGLPDGNCIVNFGGVVRCNAPDLKIGYDFPGDKITAAACRTSNNPELLWDSDCENDTLIQFIVQRRIVAGAWTDEALLPPTQFRYTPLNPGATYRVVAIRLELNSTISSTPSNAVYEDGLIGTTNDGLGATATTWMEVGYGNASKKHITVPTYTVSLVTLLNCNPDAPEDFYVGSGNALKRHVTIPTYTVDELFLISCNPFDVVEAGLESGSILDAQLTASSEFDAPRGPENARLNNPDGSHWAPSALSTAEWWKIDFGNIRQVTSISTQGGGGTVNWTTSYELEYNNDDSSNWISYNSNEVLAGNVDNSSVVTHQLIPFEARYIRFRPKTWNTYINLRAEFETTNGLPDDFYIGHGNALIRHITVPTYSVLDLTGGDIGG